MKTVQKILLEYEPEKRNLLSVLREINSEFGYISEKSAKVVADYFELPMSQVFETASFYDLLETREVSGIDIEVCFGGGCCISGSGKIIKEIEKIFGIKEGDMASKKIRLRKMSCVGMCDEGPVVKINGKIYTKVDKNKLEKIIAEVAIL